MFDHDHELSTTTRLQTMTVLVCGGLLLAASGCVGDLAARGVHATAYEIDARLDPATGRLDAQATVKLRQDESPAGRGAPLTVDIALNRSLTISEVVGKGVEVKGHSPVAESPGGEESERGLLAVHRVLIDRAEPEFELTFSYGGVLRQDVSAGEREGQIHNFVMAAHIGPEGIFLERSGGWYPFPHVDPNSEPQGELATYRLAVDRVDGMVLVAGAEFDEAASSQTGRLVWHSRRPLDGLALVGGKHHIKYRTAGDVAIELHYSVPEDPEEHALIERHTDMFLDAAEKYLARYQPLIGPFPGRRYTIVENFFSSGFAFPEFTLLARTLFLMGPRALGHGYLDHEMLHSWWGNGIYVDPADGNWCEALTSYGANYYGYVLDGDETGARKYRRNACNLITTLDPEDDQPLDTFGQEDGAGRGIGYNKGAMVFYMLANRIGQENFWSAMRRLTAEYTGKYASWRTLQTLFEEEGGAKLERFFKQWVRQGGAPRFELSGVKWHESSRTLEVAISQGEADFELDVPLRLVFNDGSQRDEFVRMDRRSAVAKITLDRKPSSVILDPDYRVLRKLQPGEIMPTTRTTRAAENLLIVTPAGEISPFYERLIHRYDKQDDSKKIDRRTVDELPAAELASRSLLIIGDAVRAEPVRDLLVRAGCPIEWGAAGFTIDGERFDEPGHSVLCTVRHPDLPGGGITVYYGNSEDALGRSDLVLYYGNSLVAFKTSASESGGEKSYHSRPVLRRDFEHPITIAVE